MSRAHTNQTAGKVPAEQITQIFYQIFIPETPTGLIGEKVVYNEKYLKRCNGEPMVPLPDQGYFTITKAIMYEDGSVMVALKPYARGHFSDGTHTSLANIKKYKEGGSNE